MMKTKLLFVLAVSYGLGIVCAHAASESGDFDPTDDRKAKQVEFAKGKKPKTSGSVAEQYDDLLRISKDKRLSRQYRRDAKAEMKALSKEFKEKHPDEVGAVLASMDDAVLESPANSPKKSPSPNGKGKSPKWKSPKRDKGKGFFPSSDDE